MLRRIYSENILLICVILAVIFVYYVTKFEGESHRKKQREVVVFVKTHKCASSTIQNILLRYGYYRNLSFVLPAVANCFGYPDIFNNEMIPFDLKPRDNKFNIFTHHARFNYEEIKKVMYNDPAFITILRNPVSQFESSYSFYRLDRYYNVSIHDIVKFPHGYVKNKPRFLNTIGVNQMSYDLGLEEGSFDSTEDISNFIKKIDSYFDLIMIFEYFEASLVLMTDILNWPLSAVQFLPRNVRTKEKRINLTAKEEKSILRINRADELLYDFFSKKFKQRIIEYGTDKMFANINKLLELNRHMYMKCVEKQNSHGYRNTTNYDIKNKNDWICNYVLKNEIDFTDEIRLVQKEKIWVIKNLQNFLAVE